MKKLCLLIVVMFVFTMCLYGEEWKVNNYVDNFGDYTNEKHISIDSWGTFSNSATNGSIARYRFILDKDVIRIDIYEYDSIPFTFYKNRSLELKIKYDNSTIVTIEGFLMNGGVRIYKYRLTDSYNKFIRLLKNKNELKVYFENNGSKYNFKINCMGFTKQYNALINQ